MCSNGVGPLHKIDNESIDVWRHIEKSYMLPQCKRKMPQGYIFQQDNDPKHTSKYVNDCMIKDKICLFEWSALAFVGRAQKTYQKCNASKYEAFVEKFAKKWGKNTDRAINKDDRLWHQGGKLLPTPVKGCT